ncbi:MAG: adenylate/guanylate cyclase domain-containing protein [Methylotenera sp.]|nr:adenylate/guanylate cyclase domain-containing protein [Methylotenera sp.]
MTDRLNKTSICSIVFLDIIDYSKKPVSEQVEDKTFFNDLINEAIQNVAPNDRIILDTGDGAAITLMGAPEEALFISLTIRDGILKHNIDNPQPLLVRIGINLGSIRVMKDLNDRPNIIGDGINVAQRIMSFAAENQILVSRSYYEVTSRLTKEITSMFSYSGVKQDKHIREHEVYIIRSKDEPALAPAIEKDFYSIGGLNLARKKIAHHYLIPVIALGLFVALGAWYLLIFRPIPISGKEQSNEPLPATAPVVTAAPVKAQVKTPDIQTNILPASKSVENKNPSSFAISQDSINPLEQSADKPITPKKKRVKKERVAEQGSEIIQPTPTLVNSVTPKPTPIKKEVQPTQPTQPVPQLNNGITPVLKHTCTQAEIIMNQCSKGTE